MTWVRLTATAACAPWLLLCASCGPQPSAVHPVTGRVLVRDWPAEGAQVVFHPADSDDPLVPRPHGQVRADGTYTLTTYKPDDGAPVGEYDVAIVWTDPKAPVNTETGEVPNRLPAHFSNPRTSNLRRRIEEGPNRIDFVLTP